MAGVQHILDPRRELFVRVAQAGSISGAALAAGLPLSVVSRQISRLEQEAGTRLFRRTGRGVVLSEAGLQVLPRIQALVREAEQLTDDLRTSAGMPMGDVRVGLLPSSVPVLAGPLFAAVRKAWPAVRLHLTEGASAQLEDELARGRLDLALLLLEGDAPADPDTTELARITLSLVLPVKHPLAARPHIAFEELAGLPLVLPSEPHPLRSRLATLAAQRGMAFGDILEADSIRLQHELVIGGGGCAITAGTLTVQEARKLAAVPIAQPVLARAIVLGVSRQRPHTLATREVARLLRGMAPVLLPRTAAP